MNKESSLIITKAECHDLSDILKLQYEAYQSEAVLYNDFSIQPLMQTLEQIVQEHRGSTFLKAVDDGKIIGSVRAHAKLDTVYINKLIVLPAYQNRGLGKRLLRAIEQEFPGKRYELFTGAKSAKNLTLYEKSGYVRYKEEQKSPGLVLIYLEKKSWIDSSYDHD